MHKTLEAEQVIPTAHRNEHRLFADGKSLDYGLSDLRLYPGMSKKMKRFTNSKEHWMSSSAWVFRPMAKPWPLFPARVSCYGTLIAASYYIHWTGTWVGCNTSPSRPMAFIWQPQPVTLCSSGG
jgi:hypothetical protein